MGLGKIFSAVEDSAKGLAKARFERALRRANNTNNVDDKCELIRAYSKYKAYFNDEDRREFYQKYKDTMIWCLIGI